ncbi:MAG: TerB family tellurite resistance protein [Pseudomonadota bacterium]
MHIILGLLSLIVAGLWAANRFLGAARSAGDAATDLKSLWRSGQWSRQVSKRLVENINDPRESAAVLLYQVASYDGAVTERQIERITSLMQEAFAINKTQADELYSFGRFAVGEVGDAGNALRKLLEPVIASCTAQERRELVDMIRAVAETEGSISDVQKRLIADVERRLLPH